MAENEKNNNKENDIWYTEIDAGNKLNVLEKTVEFPWLLINIECLTSRALFSYIHIFRW